MVFLWAEDSTEGGQKICGGLANYDLSGMTSVSTKEMSEAW